MEVMPSKFRSPPPKPPRRRHSDQLVASSTGTYPSSKKKYNDENKLCLKDDQSSIENDTRCDSLPASWNNDFSLDHDIESTVLKNGSLCSSKSLKKSYHIFQDCAFSVGSNDLADKILEPNLKENSIPVWTKNCDNSYLEHTVKPSRLSTKYIKNLPEDMYTQNLKESNSFEMTVTGNKLDLKSYQKDYHRRHNSDPVLSFLDKSNSKVTVQKCALRGHVIFGSSVNDNQNKLSNSVTTSFKLQEYKYLHEEMKNLKEINTKLWRHLCSTQVSLEKLKRKSEEAATDLSISDLLSSIYSSQRAKDSAMEDRMKVVIEERDAAIQDLEEFVQIIVRSFENDTIPEERCSDKEIKEILKEIELTYNPAKLLQLQRLLLTYLYHSKELKQDETIHELKLVTSEKDHLNEKVKYLEEELKSQQICNEAWNADNKHWENNLLKILCQVIEQRDVAFSQINVLQKMPHMNFRLDGMNNAVKRNFQAPYHEHMYEKFSLDSISDEVGLKKDIMYLSKALELETEKREGLEEKCLRLERLVDVLRKKVNGQNVGIPV